MSLVEGLGLLALIGLLAVASLGFLLFGSPGASTQSGQATAIDAPPVEEPPRVPVKKKLGHDPLQELEELENTEPPRLRPSGEPR
jgi:hypothetical protein